MRGRRRLAALVGPLAVVAVVGLWATLIVVGWTLVYLPHMPEAFFFDSGPRPATRSDLLDSVYLSLVTVGTLRYGDIVPQTAWLRLVAPLQALVGFTLLTAAVSRILQIHPALGRRRALSSGLNLLRRSDAARRLALTDSTHAAELLTDVTDSLVRVRVDLAQYLETYYFRETDQRWSLPVAIGYVGRIVEEASRSPREDVQLAAELLAAALEDFCDVLREQFLARGQTVEEVLAAYLADHGH